MEAVVKRDSRRNHRILYKNRVLSAYFHEIDKTSHLGIDEEAEIARHIQQGDQEALKALVQANLKFVVAVCRNYQNQGLPMEDLISEGNLGLLRAAKRFDGSRHLRFISYAVWWIRQAILSALAEQSRIFNVPPGRIAVMQKLGLATAKLGQKLGRPPAVSELSEAMNIDIREINVILDMNAYPLSLHMASREGEEVRLEEMLEDTRTERPDSWSMAISLQTRMKRLIGSLASREAEVLRLYYGIGVENAYSLEQIGWRLGLTRERVRQIKENALKRLRHPSRLKDLKRLDP